MSVKTLHPVVDPATQTISPEKVYPGGVDSHHPAPVLPAGFEAQADELITQRVKEALGLVDIRLLDHIVVGDGVSVSLAERGLI